MQVVHNLNLDVKDAMFYCLILHYCFLLLSKRQCDSFTSTHAFILGSQIT
jgi:hypothetical protein